MPLSKRLTKLRICSPDCDSILFRVIWGCPNTPVNWFESLVETVEERLSISVPPFCEFHLSSPQIRPEIERRWRIRMNYVVQSFAREVGGEAAHSRQIDYRSIEMRLPVESERSTHLPA